MTRTTFFALIAALSLSADNTVNFIIFSGQSLSVGTNSGPCLSQIQPPINTTGWVNHSGGTTFPPFNVSYVGSPASFIDFPTGCRAPQYRAIAGTLSIDTAGNVTGTGTNWATQHNTGIMLTGGKEFVFTYASATSGTISPAPSVAIPAGTTYSLSAASAGGGWFQSGEPHQHAVLNNLTNMHPSKDWVGSYISNGVQGYSYGQLKKNGTTSQYSGSITNLTTQAAFLSANVPANGRPRAFTVKALDIVHGEADAVYPYARYVASLREWRTDYNADVKPITGQTADFALWTDQYSSWTRSVATPTVARAAGDPAITSSYPEGAIYWNTTLHKYRRNAGGVWTDDAAGVCAPFTGGWCGTTPMAQWIAARNYPDEIKLVGPKYQYKYSDGVHLRNYSYRHLGEMHAKAQAKEFHTGQRWIPLAPRSITRTGAVISARFWVPVGCLQFDSTRNDEAVQQFAKANEGFEYFDAAGSASISSVAIASCDTVTVTLSDTPTGANQRVRYAYTGTATAIGGTAGAARGTLADNDPAVGLSGLPLRDYGISFDEPIGYRWEPNGESRSAVATAGWTTAKFTYRSAVSESCAWQASADEGFNALTAYGADTMGPRSREILIPGLTESTAYYFRAVCPSGTYSTSATTSASASPNASLVLRYRAPAGRGIDNVLVEYGASSALANSASVSCLSTCAVTLSNLTRGSAVYVKHTYRTAANASVAQSRVALEMVE